MHLVDCLVDIGLREVHCGVPESEAGRASVANAKLFHVQWNSM